MYTMSDGNTVPAYEPAYSDLALQLMRDTERLCPYVQFTVFETVLMNEFLNHLIAQNTVFLQVDRDISLFVFRRLQETGYPHLLYKPSKETLDLYWVKDCIIVTDLVSESPRVKATPHSICLEKMLVDMYCDKLISGMYSKAEYASVMEQAVTRYKVNLERLLRYARRRNKETEIKQSFVFYHNIEEAFTSELC